MAASARTQWLSPVSSFFSSYVYTSHTWGTKTHLSPMCTHITPGAQRHTSALCVHISHLGHKDTPQLSVYTYHTWGTKTHLSSLCTHITPGAQRHTSALPHNSNKTPATPQHHNITTEHSQQLLSASANTIPCVRVCVCVVCVHMCMCVCVVCMHTCL